MKILYAHLYEKRFDLGGADRGVLDLALGMRRLYKDEIMFATHRGALFKALQQSSVPVVEVPQGKIRTMEIISGLAKAYKVFKPNVVHSHHRYMTFLLDVFFKRRNVPIIHTQRVHTWDKRALFRYGNFATAVSKALAQNLVAHYRVPGDRVRPVVNAVSLPPVDNDLLQRIQEKYPRGKDQVYGLCIGRFEKQKGHSYLVESVGLLPSPYQERFKIFLAGDGPLEKSLRMQIHEQRLERSFVFLGYLREMAEFLDFSDFLILPSLWEGLPRVVLEAFCSARPVIATDIPGTSEVMQNRKNGLLVPPRNAHELAKAIRHFMDHPNDVKAMGEYAKKSSQDYSFEQMIANYRRVYSDVIERFSPCAV